VLPIHGPPIGPDLIVGALDPNALGAKNELANPCIAGGIILPRDGNENEVVGEEGADVEPGTIDAGGEGEDPGVARDGTDPNDPPGELSPFPSPKNLRIVSR
jgi:hypothetical protein